MGNPQFLPEMMAVRVRFTRCNTYIIHTILSVPIWDRSANAQKNIILSLAVDVQLSRRQTVEVQLVTPNQMAVREKLPTIWREYDTWARVRGG